MLVAPGSNGGSCSADRGQVHGSRPPGLTSPNSTRADRVAALHTRIPGHEDGAHLLPPRVGHNGAAADEHDDRPPVGGRHGADEPLVLGAERELLPVATPPQDVLALVAMGVADDHYGGVRPRGGEPGGAQVLATLVPDVDDVALADRMQAVEDRRHGRGPDVARSPVPGRGERGQPAEHRQRLDRAGVQWQHPPPLSARGRVAVGGAGGPTRVLVGGPGAVAHFLGLVDAAQHPVPEQHDRAFRNLPGQRAVLHAGHLLDPIGVLSAGSVVLATSPASKTQLLAQDAQAGVVDALGRHPARARQTRQPPEPQAERHLEVQPGVHGVGRAHTQHEVAHHEAVEAPLTLEHLGDQVVVMSAVGAVDTVVGGHHGRHALVHDPAEVREVDVMQVVVVDAHVDAEAAVLDGVAGEVLDARHHVALHPPHQSGTHLPQQV